MKLLRRWKFEKKWYKETYQTYYRPWIILLTDGEPDDGQDVCALGLRVKSDVMNKKYFFLPIGIQGANMQILEKNQGDIKPKELDGLKFEDFFKWLVAKVSAYSYWGEFELPLEVGCSLTMDEQMIFRNGKDCF